MPGADKAWNWREAPRAGWAGAEQGRPPASRRSTSLAWGRHASSEPVLRKRAGEQNAAPAGPEALLGVDWSTWSLSAGPAHGVHPSITRDLMAHYTANNAWLS